MEEHVPFNHGDFEYLCQIFFGEVLIDKRLYRNQYPSYHVFQRLIFLPGYQISVVSLNHRERNPPAARSGCRFWIFRWKNMTYVLYILLKEVSWANNTNNMYTWYYNISKVLHSVPEFERFYLWVITPCNLRKKVCGHSILLLLTWIIWRFSGWCSTSTVLLICLSFTAENDDVLLICLSPSTKPRFLGAPSINQSTNSDQPSLLTHGGRLNHVTESRCQYI